MRRDPVTGDIVLSRRAGGLGVVFRTRQRNEYPAGLQRHRFSNASPIHQQCIGNASPIRQQCFGNASAMRAAGDLAQRVLYRIA